MRTKKIVLIGSGFSSLSAACYLAKEGYDEVYGARPIARAIQHHVEDLIADEMLNGNISEGETINISFDKVKQEIIVKQPKKQKGK